MFKKPYSHCDEEVLMHMFVDVAYNSIFPSSVFKYDSLSMVLRGPKHVAVYEQVGTMDYYKVFFDGFSFGI
jgi:hypothetical protein